MMRCIENKKGGIMDLLELINNVNEYKVPSLSDFVKMTNSLLEGKDEDK